MTLSHAGPATATIAAAVVLLAALHGAAASATKRPTHIDSHQSQLEESLRAMVLVHSSREPAEMAGNWVRSQGDDQRLSEEHLACLAEERQGNCHDARANEKHPDATSRAKAASMHGILNSPEILEGWDPWVWQSRLRPYRAFGGGHHAERRLLNATHLVLIGDSLTRQWHRAMLCELEHKLNFTRLEAARKVTYVETLDREPHTRALAEALTPHSYVVYNIGHHVDPAKEKHNKNFSMEYWAEKYSRRLSKYTEKILRVAEEVGLPRDRIFFRTTNVRHFHSGAGDWYTDKSKVGGVKPDMKAKWTDYGGNHPSQPMQNLLALTVISRNTGVRVLDVAPPMLARADASFDGSHMCLPGPHTMWSKMLYAQIAADDSRSSHG